MDATTNLCLSISSPCNFIDHMEGIKECKRGREKNSGAQQGYYGHPDGYYVASKPITLSCILFMFIEMKFIHCHYCVMFAIKSMSMCND